MATVQRGLLTLGEACEISSRPSGTRPKLRKAGERTWLSRVVVAGLLIGIYLHGAGASAACSAAGALIVVFHWIYYSGRAFLLGAVFTQIYATRRRSRSARSGKFPPAATRHWRVRGACEIKIVARGRRGARGLVIKETDT